MNMDPKAVEIQKKIFNEMEETFIQTYEGMKNACTKKCTKGTYDTGDVVKSEGVCIDRCVSKYVDFYDMFGKKLSENKDVFDLLVKNPAREKPEAQT